jgi:NADH-quinone oxidoreductase subunit K
MVPLSAYLVVAACLFSIGVIGLFLNRKNVITILMCIELILLAVNINFVAFSHFLNDLAGQIFVFFVLTVAASEVAVGLAILVAFYRQRRSIDIEDINTLQG